MVSAQVTPPTSVGWPWGFLLVCTPRVLDKLEPTPKTANLFRISVTAETTAILGGAAVELAITKF